MTPEPRPSTPPRFTLAGLLELIAGIALFLALVSQLDWVGLGMAVAGLLVLAVVHHEVVVRDREKDARNVWGCLIALGGLSVAASFFLIRRESHEDVLRMLCTKNLRQLSLALHNYHDRHGHFPPPYVADANGKPMHSWRVLILPHLAWMSCIRRTASTSRGTAPTTAS